MAEQYWDRPVDIHLAGIRNARTITATRFARECLLTLWPDHYGPAYLAALKICAAAMDGTASGADARTAFIEAAREADILVG
jgi:hypothetical protein